MEARYGGALEASPLLTPRMSFPGWFWGWDSAEQLRASCLFRGVDAHDTLSQRPWEKNLLPHCHFVKCLLLRCDPATLSVGFYFLSACCPYVTLIVAIILEQWGSYFTGLN